VLLFWLWPPCIAYVDILFYRCGVFFFLAYSQRMEIGCGLSANLECRSEICCTQLAQNIGPPKNHHLGTIVQHHTTTVLWPFLGPPGWAGARRELLDVMVQGKINRGRHTDHPAGHHSMCTNQCPPPPSPHFLQARCPFCHPTNSVEALKAIAQLCRAISLQLKHVLTIGKIWLNNNIYSTRP